jgi:uncharacterized protein YqjF (DUF2071 family)
LRLAEPAKPGIYFLSLDADSPAAAATRRSYRLPYFHSRISAGSAGEGFHLRLDEDVIRRPGSVFRRQVRAAGSADSDRDGSLERWLTERNLSAELGDARSARSDQAATA